VRHIAFSPDGRYLVTGSHDRMLRIWEAATGRLHHIIRGAMAKIQSATAFSPDGQVLAYAGGDRIELRFRVQPIAQMIWRILFSPDGKFLAVCGSGGAKLIINVASGEVAYALPGVSGAFDLAFGGEGQYLAAAGPDPTIVIRDAATGKVWHTLKGHLAEVIALDAGTADNMIASGSIDGAVRL
jgi:WD40 repeat protein